MGRQAHGGCCANACARNGRDLRNSIDRRSENSPQRRSCVMTKTAQPNARQSIRQHARPGLAAVLALVGGLGGWAALTELSGAVVAGGAVVVDSHVKKVQHPTGGVVGEILARDGSRVRAGDVVVRLDETVAKANLAMVSKGLDELMARQARLEAERDGRNAVVFAPALQQRRI